MKKLLLCLSMTASTALFGQISPPGLGDTRMASWLALGLRQGLDSANHIQSISYFGAGRMSDPDQYNPSEKPAILVLNQEFYNQFRPRGQYSLALSYRRQNEYLDAAPYAEDDPALKQEFRVYGRLSYMRSNAHWKLVGTFRQEFRTFFSPDFQAWEEQYQFRTRFRLQLSYNFDRAKVHRIVSSAEALNSISRLATPIDAWTPFAYRESRFCLYYSLAPPASPFVFNFGYMNNLVGSRAPKSGHYMALDMIWENPFVRLKRAKTKEKPTEYME